jgi:hypothetical protein
MFDSFFFLKIKKIVQVNLISKLLLLFFSFFNIVYTNLQSEFEVRPIKKLNDLFEILEIDQKRSLKTIALNLHEELKKISHFDSSKNPYELKIAQKQSQFNDILEYLNCTQTVFPKSNHYDLVLVIGGDTAQQYLRQIDFLIEMRNQINFDRTIFFSIDRCISMNEKQLLKDQKLCPLQHSDFIYENSMIRSLFKEYFAKELDLTVPIDMDEYRNIDNLPNPMFTHTEKNIMHINRYYKFSSRQDAALRMLTKLVKKAKKSSNKAINSVLIVTSQPYVNCVKSYLMGEDDCKYEVVGPQVEEGTLSITYLDAIFYQLYQQIFVKYYNDNTDNLDFSLFEKLDDCKSIMNGEYAEILNDLKLINEINPKKKNYDIACIVSGDAKQTHKQLTYLKEKWKEGVRFKGIVFLSHSCRILSKYEEDYLIKNSFNEDPLFECDENLLPPWSESSAIKDILDGVCNSKAYDLNEIPLKVRDEFDYNKMPIIYLKASFDERFPSFLNEVTANKFFQKDGIDFIKGEFNTLKKYSPFKFKNFNIDNIDSILFISSQPNLQYQQVQFDSLDLPVDIEVIGPKLNSTSFLDQSMIDHDICHK